mmetsp:Transcript_2905/g.7087  ORF Transcript_2905/g.7087 Transcript_2905/m.7087 type:complete len:227 (+) Transcript_2905:1371-2051(+)
MLSVQDGGARGTQHGVVGEHNHLQAQQRARPHAPHRARVPALQVAVQPRLRAVLLVKHVEGKARRGWQAQRLDLCRVLLEGVHRLFNSGFLASLDGYACHVTIKHVHTVAVGTDAELLANEGCFIIRKTTKHLGRFNCKLFFLSGNIGHYIVMDVQHRQSWISRPTHSLHGHHKRLLHTKLVIKRLERGHNTCGCTVRVCHNEPCAVTTLLLLMVDDMDVRRVHGW